MTIKDLCADDKRYPRLCCLVLNFGQLHTRDTEFLSVKARTANYLYEILERTRYALGLETPLICSGYQLVNFTAATSAKTMAMTPARRGVPGT